MVRRGALLFGWAVAVLATGCTPSQGYEFVREAGESRARCERELTVEAQRACEADYRKSYETYQTQRAEVLQDAADDEAEEDGEATP